MSDLNGPVQLFLTHLANSCIYHHKHYITQSRETQQALILKWSHELLPMSTLDKTIRRVKDRWFILKQYRNRTVRGIGNVFTSSLTVLTWVAVVKMRRRGLLTKGHMKALREIFDGMKKRGPAKLRATPAAQDKETGKSRHGSFLFPT